MPTGNGQPRIYDTSNPGDWTPGNTLFTPLLVEELRARVELAGNQVINVDTQGSVLEVDVDILLYFPNPLTAPEQAAADNQVLIHNGTQPPPADTVNEDVTQAAHGFVVGDVVRFDAGLYLKARADTPENSEAQGIVARVFDVDNFEVIFSGRCDNVLTSLTPDTVYFLSDTTPGLLTTVEPAISKPILYAKSASCGIVYNMRATTGGGGGSGGGSDITVEDEGVPLTTAVKLFNFTGVGVTVSEPVADQVDVTIPGGGGSVFGGDYQYNSSDGESSTTSTLWQTKVSLVTPSLPAGTYRIGYTYQPGIDTNSVLGEFRVQRNAVTISQSSFESDNDRHLWGGFFHVATSGVQTITIQYCSPDGYAAAQIRRARLEIWRVA